MKFFLSLALICIASICIAAEPVTSYFTATVHAPKNVKWNLVYKCPGCDKWHKIDCNKVNSLLLEKDAKIDFYVIWIPKKNKIARVQQHKYIIKCGGRTNIEIYLPGAKKKVQI